MITVGHQNVHKEPEAIDGVLARGGQSISVNELGHRSATIERFAKEAGYETFHIPGTANPVRTSLNTRILFRDNLTVIGGLGLLAAEEASPSSIAPARWLYGISYLVEGRPLTHLTLHNHAHVDDRPADLDRVEQAAEALATLGRVLWLLHAEGHAVVLTGDLNTRDHAKSKGWQDAGELFRNRGLKYKAKGLDWCVWTPDRLRLRKFEAVSKEAAHSDHPGLLATFTRVAS